MDRRQVMRAAVAGLAACTLPGWITACRSAQGTPSPPTDAVEPSGDGRALLILHVEDDEGRANEFGWLVGTFLLHARDEQVALLAGCDLACATTHELVERAPECAVRKDVRAVVVRSGEQ